MAEQFPIRASASFAAWKVAGGRVDEPIAYEEWAPLHLLAAEGNQGAVIAILDCDANVDRKTEANLQGSYFIGIL